MTRAAELLARLLEDTNSTAPVVSFGTLLEQMYAARYTGQIVLHVFNGVPRALELPQSVRVDLVAPGPPDPPA